MPEKGKKYSYSEAGVDIKKADSFLEGLKGSITSTFSGRVLNDLSSFAGLFEPDLKGYKHPVLVSSTDGVGTKLLLAKETGNYTEIGQDLVAMCINDIICSGALPLFFLDYIACGKIDEKILGEVIGSISKSCKICRAALIGGETAEMPGMYGQDDIDLAGFAVGLADKQKIITPDKVKEGDALIGIASSGVHSNGFSLIRKLVKDKALRIDKPYEGGGILAEDLLAPTRLYFPLIDQILNKYGIDIHGIAHITGGGFYGNINRILPPGLDAAIEAGKWKIPPIFDFFMQLGPIDKKEMFGVFNMGIGMAMIAKEEDFQKIEKISMGTGDKAYLIGRVKKGNRKVKIDF